MIENFVRDLKHDLHSSSGLILASGLVFVVFAIASGFIVKTYGIGVVPVSESFVIIELPDEMTFSSIFGNNIFPLAGLLTGPVTLGMTSLAIISFNGLAIGMIAAWGANNGLSFVEILILLVPHGVFEFAALWIATAAGLKLPYGYLRYVLGSQDEAIRVADVEAYFRLSLFALFLLIVAALIEATLTDYLVGYVV